MVTSRNTSPTRLFSLRHNILAVIFTNSASVCLPRRSGGRRPTARAVQFFKWRIYGQVVSALAHAPISTDEGGRYGSVKPAPTALLPGARAKLLPTGGMLSVPTDAVP